MAFLKINGQELSIDDLNSWVTSFVVLFRKRKIPKTKTPKEIADIIEHENDNKNAVDNIIKYLYDHGDYMETLILLVQNSAGEMLIERKLGRK